jgi:hypothetical protein
MKIITLIVSLYMIVINLGISGKPFFERLDGGIKSALVAAVKL